MRVQLPAIAFAVALVAACGAEPEPADPAPAEASAPAAPMLPDVIVAERGGFIPEGVEYDMDNGRLLTGSLSEGSVYQLHEDGRVTPLVSDPDLVSSVGIEADELRNRLLVANSDRAVFQGGTRGQAMLGVYDLTTGERIAMVDLAAAVDDAGDDAAFFANDVAVADDGAAYVTDTRMNLVYRVDADYHASVFHRFDDDGSGPNGIVEHPAGYLLVARGDALWKVPLDDPAVGYRRDAARGHSRPGRHGVERGPARDRQQLGQPGGGPDERRRLDDGRPRGGRGLRAAGDHRRGGRRRRLRRAPPLRRRRPSQRVAG